ncbi:hypothetical protein PIB30_063707 [Stylosanthes scabra]|uniref:Uncharacterized protein n=1 Tax=Stylosanthes scabra TaxID=79078 RepID=A0ABU6QLD4_9FABA|nr:hypothetical protein [Stylosanthes scabra]
MAIGRSHMPRILFLSNRHNGINVALEDPACGWLPSSAYRSFCARDVVANFALTFKSADARKLLLNAAYANNQEDLDYSHGLLEVEDRAMAVWKSKTEKDFGLSTWTMVAGPNWPRRCRLRRHVGRTRKNCDQRGSTAGDDV